MAEKNFAVNHTVKQSSESALLLDSLPATAIKILSVLANGGTARDAAKQTGTTKQNVSQWIKKLIKLGLLRLQVKDVFKLYSLTPYGQAFTTTSGEAMVFEDYAVKFAVLQDETKRIDWVKLGDPLNWEKLGVRIGGVRVVKTSQSVIIHPGKMYGHDLDALKVDAGRVIEHVRSILVNEFGMKLGDVGVPLHDAITRFYSDEAKEDIKNGTVNVEGVGSIDASPPEKIPHEEYNGVERAKERLLLPDRVKTVNDKVDQIEQQMITLTNSVDRLADSMTNIADSVRKLTETFSSLLLKEPERDTSKHNTAIPKNLYE
jgi:DNA-binding MarR family transcriptional regulator